LLTTAYREAITGVPMYVKTGGTVTVENSTGTGGISLVSGRFTIGAKGATATSSTSQGDGGVFDLSKPYKITVKIASASGTAGKKFMLLIDNNSSSGGNSIWGANSVVINKTLAEVQTAIADNGGVLTYTSADPVTVGNATSFVQLRTETGLTVIIDSVKIETLSATSGGAKRR
jgi:pectate lyase